MCSDAPDTTQMNQAAADSAVLARESLDWYKAEYAKTAPQREAAAALAAKVGDAQYRGMEFATNQAQELDDRNKAVFRPLEDKIVTDATNFDTEGRREELAGMAAADVNRGFASAHGQSIRQMASQGVNPSSGRAGAMDAQMATAQALALAGGANKARHDATAEGYARKMDAAGLGKGIISNQATMQQIAQSGGGQAVAAAGSGANVAQSGAGLMQAGFGGAQNSLSSTANIYGQVAKIDQSSNDGMMAGLGQAAGLATKLYMSDENIKSNTGKPADTKKALAELDATQVDDGWRYDAAKGAPAELGNAEHTGPMAQEVRKTMGERVAPGGKQIDIVSMNGKLMASMQELSKRVKKIEKRVAA